MKALKLDISKTLSWRLLKFQYPRANYCDFLFVASDSVLISIFVIFCLNAAGSVYLVRRFAKGKRKTHAATTKIAVSKIHPALP